MPSSPNGPCSTGKTTSLPCKPAPGRQATTRLPSARHTPSRADLDHRDLVAGGPQPVGDRRRRGQRDLVLGGAAAGRAPRRAPGSWSWPASIELVDVGSVVGVVGVVGVVVVVGAGRRRPGEAADHDRDGAALLERRSRRPGSAETTIPSLLWLVTSLVLLRDLEARRLQRAGRAAGRVSGDVGHLRGGRRLATTIVTVVPGGSLVSPPGLWLITLPAVRGRVVSVVVVATLKPALDSSSAGRRRPTGRRRPGPSPGAGPSRDEQRHAGAERHAGAGAGVGAGRLACGDRLELCCSTRATFSCALVERASWPRSRSSPDDRRHGRVAGPLGDGQRHGRALSALACPAGFSSDHDAGLLVGGDVEHLHREPGVLEHGPRRC